MANTMPVADVIVRDDLYPRFRTDPELIQRYAANLEVLPPIEVNQHRVLIDGMHRLTAHRSEGLTDIAVTVTETASDAELLRLACRRNATHGAQLSNADKQRMARRIYNDAADAERPALKKELAGVLSVSGSTMQRWLSRIDKDAAAERRERIFGLWLACYTDREIGEAVGLDHTTIVKMRGGADATYSDLVNFSQMNKIHQTAAEFGNGGFDVPLYNVWKRKVKSDGVAHPGNSEPDIIERLLYLYTDPFGVVVDPFAGGGSTIDICRKRFRRYYASDLTPIVAREMDIRQHDITQGLPGVPRWRDVQLVYLDPPYWRQAEGWYGDSPANLANMDADTFHWTMQQVIKGFACKLRAGAKIAMLMQPTQWKAPDRGFVDHTMAIARAIDMPIVQRFQCPYESQQATAQMVEWAKDNRQTLVLSRELTVWEVPK